MKRLIIAAVMAVTLAPLAQAKNAQAVDTRVNGVCGAMVDALQMADPNVVFDMCWRGARDAYQGSPTTCPKKIKQFEQQAEKLDGMKRGEYVQIGEAYRAGCNNGKSSKDAGY